MAQRPNWFIALPIQANHWFDRCVQSPPEGLRKFDGQDLHLTVAFLGACGEEAALRAWRCAPRWPTGPLSVRLGEVVPMGNPRRWTALSALLDEGGEAVESAIASCRDCFWDSAGARHDTRPPKAHVTLARPRPDATPAQRIQALQWAETLDLREIRIEITSLALYTWAKDRRTRQFRVVERHSF